MPSEGDQRQPIIPEPINDPVPGYAEGHWDYPRRCSDVEAALTAARERVEEWDSEADAHGWWHERPHWIALYNEILRLRKHEDPSIWMKTTPVRGSWRDKKDD